jgi:hypothetical protein
MLSVAAVRVVEIVIGIPLIIVGLLVTGWINDWMKRGKRWP